MRPDNHKNNKGYLKRRILIPLAVIIAITVMVFSAATIWHVLNAIEREAETQVRFTDKSYRNNLESDARQMAAVLDLITQDEAIRSALANQDREALQRLASPYYRSLNHNMQITHFYFTRPDRVNLLRLHNPPRSGDLIDRFTTLEAERRKEVSYGLELGVLGTFTLRVVKPWFHNGKLLGYVELGEEIDHIVEQLRQTLGVNLFIFIDKQELDKEKWVEGMRMLGREGEWGHYPEHILVSAPPERTGLPEEIENRLRHDAGVPFNRTFDVSIPEERYKATFLPLNDVRNKQVGMMLLMSPTEHWFSLGRNTVLGATLLFLLIGGGVFIAFYRLADNTEKVLENTREKLMREAEEKERLQERHIEELQQQNRLLQQAKTEIQANQERLEEAQRIAHIGSWEWDIVSNRLNWSDEVYRIFGHTPGAFEATYQAFLQAIHPDHRERVEQAIKESLDSGQPYELEHGIIRPDGSEGFVRELGEVIYDDRQQPARMIGTVHDVTKRRLAEQSSQQLGHIFDNASNEIYLIEPDTLRIIEANHTAEQRLDYALREMRQLHYSEIAVDLSSERLHSLTEPLRKGTMREVRFEAIHRCKNGQSYPVEVRLQRSDGGKHYIAMSLDISERMEQQLALQHQAMYDKLTELPNRYMLAEQLEREVGRARRNGYSLTLMQINISGFGEINDTLGHNKGDQVLIQVSERLRSMVRQSDLVARIGGDEFVLLLPESGVDNVDSVLSHLQQTLSLPFQIGDYSLNIEVATGVAIYPDHADNARELMQHTDVALKRAKSFHTLTEIYRPDFDPFSVRRLVLNSEMRQAISRGEFSLHFQPKVTAADHAIDDAEALIRWHHPEHGEISPSEFIPLAEKNGYIRHVTLWVIDETARQLHEWLSQGIDLKVSINLSARNLHDPELVSHITSTTDKYGVPARNIAFEVTETAVMTDPDFTRTLLLELNDIGHPIAIDDYGTGYSSLSYIHRLPADELKIDSSFILSMLDSEDSALIVRSTIELAHNLGMRVTAEGVETLLHAEILTNLGCDLLQGYYYSKPIAAADFTELLRTGIRQIIQG